MESLGVTQFAEIYRRRRVLVTGHTGFKGSWLSLWLTELGADVVGISLDPGTEESHWNLLKLGTVDCRQDIRDMSKLQAVVEYARPEIIFHLAAQPLVRRSYRDPIENWSTNVMGTANILEASRQVGGVKAVVAVTSDKVYANQEWAWGYRETDRLGGHDPYSASKAACEILIDSYRSAFFIDAKDPLLASARGGNVIGGGDWSEDRLIPDVVRSVGSRRPLVVRSPGATRPWQHVLDCLAGYLLLGQKLLEGHREHADAWNFGPALEDSRSVVDVLDILHVHWPELAWEHSEHIQPHETRFLYLDHSKATTTLGWRPVWGLAQALHATADWYRKFYRDGIVESRNQLARYIEAARLMEASWAPR